jgi:hypothetical protein
MTPAAKSVCYFGFYLYVTGITLMVVPNIFLTTLQLPTTTEVWIRVVGVLVMCIGYYYHKAGASNIVTFFKHTIPTRVFICLAFISFVILKFVSPLLIGFGLVDLAGAIWTYLALQKGK